MGFQMDAFTLRGKACQAFIPASLQGHERLPLILLPGSAEMSASLPQILETADQAIHQGHCKPFIFMTFLSDDWARDFTPWPAPPLPRNPKPFAGEASKTLDWLIQDFLPEAEALYPIQKDRAGRYLLGYSLGGLFALWALSKSDQFGGCAACSSSLWYDDWLSFSAMQSFLPDSRIYLSLGCAEENTRNARMATVGEATRAYADGLAHNPNVIETTLQWHKGGHFHKIPNRILNAILWLMAKKQVA